MRWSAAGRVALLNETGAESNVRRRRRKRNGTLPHVLRGGDGGSPVGAGCQGSRRREAKGLAISARYVSRAKLKDPQWCGRQADLANVSGGRQS